MPARLDYAFVAFLVVVMSVVEHVVFWPRFRGDIEAGHPRARVRGYRWVVGGQLAFGAAVMAIWTSAGRPLADLRLATPTGWRLALSFLILAAITWLATYQLRAIARTTAERRVALRPRLGAVAFLLPRTAEERWWFMAVAVTAGVCEELIYRGYLVWMLTPWIGPIGAAAGVVALFGVGHAYQGRKGFMRATLAGAVMGIIVLGTGWLVPAMIVHAVVDGTSGAVGYTLLKGATT